jgi:hypothetical protein
MTKIINIKLKKENKEMDKVELKVNVINQLRLLRQSTFKDVLCFLDEDIQNAQRAKATEVRVTVDRNDNKLIIENNGKVLNNPQALFSIAESEWDEDVTRQENPFGMGFFSNITISNLIQVHTGNKFITFDVEDMINTNNTEIKVEEVEDIYEGFKLTLFNFNFDIAHSWDVKERVEILGKYIHELDIYYNDELQEKKDLTTGDNSEFQFSIDDNNDFKGWIALANNYSYGDNLNVFYKGRLVSKLEGLPYLKGDLHVSDRTLNLTSPDRKDIIKDSKLSEFRSLLKTYIQDYCNQLLLDGEEQINSYTSCIGYYVDKKQVKNLIKFMTFKSNEEKDIEYLKGIALAKSKNKDIGSFSDYELFLRKEASNQSEEHLDEFEVFPKLETEPQEAKGRVVHESSSSYSDGYVETPEIKEKELVEQRGEMIIQNQEPVFYIGFNEVDKFEYKLNVAKHYSLRIIVARNDVEASILKNMKDSDNVIHISELKEEVDVIGNISNTSLSNKERRALMIFNMISEILGFDHNLFSIGDLMVTKNVKVESIDVDETIIDDSIVVLKDNVAKKIYVDRSVINQNKLREDTDSNLDILDYKFIMANFKAIVKQISELGFMKQTECEDKILNVLGNSR